MFLRILLVLFIAVRAGSIFGGDSSSDLNLKYYNTDKEYLECTQYPVKDGFFKFGLEIEGSVSHIIKKDVIDDKFNRKITYTVFLDDGSSICAKNYPSIRCYHDIYTLYGIDPTKINEKYFDKIEELYYIFSEKADKQLDELDKL